MIVLRVSTEGALPSGFPDVFWGLGRILPNKRSEETACAVIMYNKLRKLKKA